MAGHLPTIYSVAAEAGVSTATVSRALRDKEKVSPAAYAAVMTAIEKLNYVPKASAASLAKNQTGTLGLVLPHIAGWYYAELVVGFEMAASELGQAAILTLANPRADARQSVRDLAEKVDGIAFLARSAVTDEMIRTIGRARYVVTGARAQIPGIESIRAENELPAYELTTRLIESGRKNILFVGTPEVRSDISDRHNGYLRAHQEHGLTPPKPVLANLEPEEGERVATELLEAKARFDALVCANDHLALTLTKTLQSAGLNIPADVAITGWDNLLAARFITPALTTVAQPVVELGATAARRLHRLILGGPPSIEPLVFPSETVLRDSCGTRF